MESRKVEKYTIYSNGRIHDDYYDTDIIPQKGSGGYLKAKLFLTGKYSQMYIHEIVAQLFMPDYNPKFKTIHKDGNIFNNNISNLTQIDPLEYAIKTKANKLPDYKVIAFNSLDMSTIEFKGLDEAALWIRSTGVLDSIDQIKLKIFNVTDDKNKTAYNYKWNSV